MFNLINSAVEIEFRAKKGSGEKLPNITKTLTIFDLTGLESGAALVAGFVNSQYIAEVRAILRESAESEILGILDFLKPSDGKRGRKSSALEWFADDERGIKSFVQAWASVMPALTGKSIESQLAAANVFANGFKDAQNKSILKNTTTLKLLQARVELFAEQEAALDFIPHIQYILEKIETALTPKAAPISEDY